MVLGFTFRSTIYFELFLFVEKTKRLYFSHRTSFSVLSRNSFPNRWLFLNVLFCLIGLDQCVCLDVKILPCLDYYSVSLGLEVR